MPLEYEPPRPTAPGWRRDFLIGLFAALFISSGIGSAIFGALSAADWRDDHAGPVAIGCGLIFLGGTFVALMLWLRRSYR
jgi:hypothetical protein